jgi:DNA adenine methylase
MSEVGALAPPLKWAGGKRWLVPRLRRLWASFRDRRYVEPFVGGLAVPLGLRPRRALLNDLNPHLIYFYRHLQRGLTPQIAMRNDPDLYYAHRERFNALIAGGRADSAEAAALFYYLNRTGFNGLCRFNRRGAFNVPFGRHKQINYLSSGDLAAYREALTGWEFTYGDFTAMDVREDDFIYVDPPYDVDFVSYAKEGFSWDDQLRLVAWLARLPCPTVASNQATDRILEVYRQHGFTVKTLYAPRRISASGDRTPALEMLAWRNIDQREWFEDLSH